MSGILTSGSQKDSMLLAEIRKKYPSYHPILAIVDIAHNADADLELQFNCHKVVAKYIEPELKSIEVKGDFKTHQSVSVSLFEMPTPEDVEFTELGMGSAVDTALAEY